MPTTADVTREMIVRTAVWSVFSAALLFVPAGTINWPEGWIYLAIVCGLGLVSGLIIAKHDPALVKERMGAPVQKEQKSWDKSLALHILPPVPSHVRGGRARCGAVPDLTHALWLEALGVAGVLLGMSIIHVVMRTNTFAAPVVKIRTERKHHVISTGPYAYVRHPMYGGAIPLILGTGVICSGRGTRSGIGVLLIILLAYRAVLEEETLKRETEGYAAYASGVRYRLVPGLW